MLGCHRRCDRRLCYAIDPLCGSSFKYEAQMAVTNETNITATRTVEATASVLGAMALCHLLNDTIQSVIPSIYPILKETYGLSFTEIGTITMVWQLVASILQPIVGLYTDRRPQPFSLPIGMAFTFTGLIVMSSASRYGVLLGGVALVGMGSAIFHPEASRIARMASGGRHGFAQSLFQVGGNVGSAIGPLLAALLIVPHGQRAVAFVGILAVVAMILMMPVGFWSRARRVSLRKSNKQKNVAIYSRATIYRTLTILILLMFSKFIYMASFSSYYVFYMMDKFGLTVPQSQIHLFIFLAAVAIGTIIGGPLGDRFGRRGVIWFSILGALPFSLAVPWSGLYVTTAFSATAGLILASAFPAIVVYGQELLPGKVGAISGLFFGLAFGAGGLGGALLGMLADRTNIGFVYQLAAFLPVVGCLAFFLPRVNKTT